MRHKALLYSFVLIAISAGTLRFGEGGQQPSFRADLQLVEVQVIATGKRGQPIRDLTQLDFQVFEDDQLQRISAFSSVDIPMKPLPGISGSLESDVVTNSDLTGNRLWVLLLDSPAAASTNTFAQGATYTRLTQNVARRFVDEVVSPADFVAVIHVQGSMTASQPLTRSRSLALRSIERFSAGPGLDAVTPREAIAMIVNTYRTIEEVAKRLGAVSVRRKALLWIGGQVPFDPEGGQGPKEFQVAAPILHAAYRDAIKEAQRNHVAIYPVDPYGLSTGSPTPPPRLTGLDGLPLGAPVVRPTAEPDLLRQAALRIVAEETGGYAVVNTNDFTSGFEQIRNENGFYYLLGYYPPVQHADGKFHEIRVRVTRPDVAVRARKGYVAPLAAAGKEAAATNRVATAADALRNPLPATGIRMSVFATPFRGTSTPGNVVIGAHINGEDLSQAGDNVLQIAYQVIDAEARTIAMRTMDYTLPLDADQMAMIRHDGLRFIEALPLRRGRFEIRLAAAQRGGPAGSVVTYVDVPDFNAGRLSMSGLLLGSRSFAIPVRLGKPAGVSTEVDSTALREFPTTATLTVSAVVYSDTDIPLDGIVIDASILDGGDNLLRDGAKGLIVRERRTSIGERVVEVEVPLQGLRPGPYVFRLSARLTRGGRATSDRALPFRVVSE